MDTRGGGGARGVKYSCAVKVCVRVCAVIAKKQPRTGGRDRAKEDCGGFVFISTHFSLERGFRGKVEKSFAGCRVSFKYLFWLCG